MISDAVGLSKLRLCLLTVFANLVDCDEEVVCQFEAKGFLAHTFFRDFYWSFCPPGLFENELEIWRELTREARGSELFDAGEGRSRVGYKSSLLDALAENAGISSRMEPDWVRAISARERQYRETEASGVGESGRSVMDLRRSIAKKSRDRREAEIAFLLPKDHIAKALCQRRTLVEVAKRFFHGFDAEPASRFDPTLLLRRVLSDRASIGIALLDASVLKGDAHIGNFGLVVVAEISTPSGVCEVRKPIFDIVLGFRVYAACKSFDHVRLCFLASSVIYESLRTMLESGILECVSGQSADGITGF